MKVNKERESPQIKRYRRKIKEQLEAESGMMTEAALAKVKKSITQRLSRTPERISLQDRTIALFDENRHPEPTHNKFVIELFAKIRTGAPISTTEAA